MLRSSWNRERGSALIEVTVIGSFVFIVVVASVSAVIDTVVVGGAAQASARTAAVHAARHAGTDAAHEIAGTGHGRTVVSRADGSIRVSVSSRVLLPHPGGLIARDLLGVAEMSLAPYRSDRG